MAKISLLCSLVFIVVLSWNFPEIECKSILTSSLVTSLIAGADANVRPNADPGSPSTNVSVNIMLSGIKILDDNEDVMRIDGYMSMKWHDSRLQWDPSAYDGLSLVRMPMDNIWTPDLTVYQRKFDLPVGVLGYADNMMVKMSPDSQMAFLSDEHNIGIVYATGDLLWVPKVTMLTHYNTTKSSNGTLYQAKVLIGSWAYDGNALDYPQDTHATVDYSDYHGRKFTIQNSTITRQSATYPCCEEQYPRLQVTLDVLKVEKD